MNFPPFGSHFPGTIPSIHQFTADGSGAGAGAGTGGGGASVGIGVGSTSSRYGNHFTNQPPIGVPVVGKYRTEINGTHASQSSQGGIMINNKTSYSNSNIHHYPNIPYSQSQSIHQRLSNSPVIMQEKRSYHQVILNNTSYNNKQMNNQLIIINLI